MKNLEIKPIAIWGSLQNHRVEIPFEREREYGGICPTIGTTDFGLPRVLYEYNETNPDR